MTLTEKLRVVSTALTQISVNFYHYTRPVSQKAPYGVWQEDREDTSFYSGNSKTEQQIHGTIDLYTLQEFDHAIDEIQEVLSKNSRIEYALNSVQYEDETKLIHYEWDFWVY